MGIKSYINIREAIVGGINKPTFILHGNCDYHDYDIEIEVDGKLSPEKITKSLSSGDFEIFLPINKTDNQIDVYLIHEGTRELVCSRKNTTVKRIKAKIKTIIKKPLKLCWKVYKVVKYVIYHIYKAIRLLWRDYHFLVPPRAYKGYFEKLKGKVRNYGNSEHYYNFLNQDDYLNWLKINPEKYDLHPQFEYNPLISICIPVYNVERKYLADCLDSILNQTYQNFEICLSDDCSTLQETKDTLKDYEKKDKRIKVFYRQENGHISKATNDALSIAKGEFIGLMDNDDLLAPNALAECVNLLNEDKTIDFIYSDEDKMDLAGKRRDPHFKPEYSPDTLLGNNYFCHFEIMRKTIVDEIGGFRVGYEGAQDYDLFLRFVEKTNNIHHIPKILYHWRMIEGSTAAIIDSKGYAVEKGRKSVEDALKRRHLNATVSVHPVVPYYLVEYHYETPPMISIIIPTRDYADITEQCLKSLYKKTTYKNFEVILMNNNSEKQETFDLFEKYKKLHKNFRVVDANYEFNYSKINNQGEREAKGDYILLLNNDTEIITPNWLEIMVGYAMQDHIGTVGAKLLYPDDTVQHSGIILGIGGIAQHAFIGNPRDDVGFYGRLAVPFNYSAVTAACLMISKKKYEEVGGLEEKLQVTFNDVDFNMKILEKGYYNICLNQVELYHHESKSRGLDVSSEKYKRFVSEHDFVKSRWGNKLYNDRFYNPNLSMHKAFVLDR